MSPRVSAPSKNAGLKNIGLRSAAPVFAALGDETRLRLVVFLCDGAARSIAQLTSETDITRQAVTKHLQVLAEAGLVRDVRAGRERLWELKPERIEEARHSLELMSAHWDHALGKLKRVLEDGETHGRK